MAFRLTSFGFLGVRRAGAADRKINTKCSEGASCGVARVAVRSMPPDRQCGSDVLVELAAGLKSLLLAYLGFGGLLSRHWRGFVLFQGASFPLTRGNRH